MIKDRVIQKRIKGKVLAMAMTAVVASFFVPFKVNAAATSTSINKDTGGTFVLTADYKWYTLKPDGTKTEESSDKCLDDKGNCAGHTFNGTKGSQSEYGIKVEGGNHKITLKDVEIGGSQGIAGKALQIDKGAKVDLTLEGTNNLISGEGNAGIYVPETAELTIDGTGSLDVKSYFGGAGIGGEGNGDGVSAGKITINSGTIKATGGAGGAGIGGYKGGGAGEITINGGVVNAFGGTGMSGNSEGAPGIGNGSSGNVLGTVKINGGTVNAWGGQNASGTSQADGISCKTLTSTKGIPIEVVANRVNTKNVNTSGFHGLIWDAKLEGNVIKKDKKCTVYNYAIMPNGFELGDAELYIPFGSSFTVTGTGFTNTGYIHGEGKLINADKVRDGIGGTIEIPIKNKVVGLEAGDIEVVNPNLIYTGADLKNKVCIEKQTRSTSIGMLAVDYEGWNRKFFEDDSNSTSDESPGTPVKDDIVKDAGKYIVRYSNGYSGFNVKFEIDQRNIAECEVKPVPSKDYIGRPYDLRDFQAGDIVVSYDGKELSMGDDYNCEFPKEKNKNAGIATIEIGAMTTGNFVTTDKPLEAHYTINPASLEKANVTIDTKEFLYDGKDHKAEVTKVSLESLQPENGSKDLTPGDDYKVEYFRGDKETTDFKNAGIITIKISGVGDNFTGEISETYEIKKVILKVKSITAKSRQYNGNSEVEITAIDIDFTDPANTALILKDDLASIVADTKHMRGIILDANGAPGVNVGSYTSVKLENVSVSTDSVGSNYSVDGTYIVGAAGGVNLLTAPVVIEQRDAPELNVGGTYTVSPNLENKFIHTVTVTGKTENDVIDSTGNPPSKVWVWMDTEDQDAENSQKKEAVWTALDPENNPNVLTPIAVFDNIEPESIHTFYAYATESTNVKGSEVYSDPDRKFDLLERTDKPEAGVLTINPEPNEDGETYTATITPPEGDAGPFEYGFDSGNGVEWQESPTKADCLSGTLYTGYIRYAATKVYLANTEGTQCGEPVSTEMLQAKKPEITTSAGGTTFGGRTNVIIAYPTAMPGMEIYYTTDGSTPSKDGKKSTLYKEGEPFAIDKTTTVKAIATRSNMKDSDMAEELFTAEEAIEVADGKVQSLTDSTIPPTLMGVQLDPDSPPISNAESIRTYMNAYLRTMNTGYEFDNVAYYDLTVEMRIYDKNGKQIDSVPAGENDFPRKVDLTYDNLRSADSKFPDLNGETKYDLVAVHMYSGQFDKFKAGEMENITKIDQVEGDHLSFTVNGTSPLAIGWKVATNPDDPNNPDNPDDPNNPDDPDDPNNPDNPDDPNNPDGDPNGDGSGNQNGDGTGDGTTSTTNAAEQGVSDDSKNALSNLMPKTGDPISFIPWIAAAVVSIGVIVGLVKKKGGKKKTPKKTTKKTTKKSTQKTKKK